MQVQRPQCGSEFDIFEKHLGGWVAFYIVSKPKGHDRFKSKVATGARMWEKLTRIP